MIPIEPTGKRKLGVGRLQQTELVPTEVTVLQDMAREVMVWTREVSDQVTHAANALGDKYLNICRHIREHQIAPKVVSRELAAAGFLRQRITELNRVAQCADVLWNEVDARRIGFRVALDRARTDITKLEHVEPVDGLQPDGAAAASKLPPTEEDREKAKFLVMDRCAKTIIVKAEDLGKRSKTWKLNGYTLKLSLDKGHPRKRDTQPY